MQTVAEIISVIGSVFWHTGVFPNFPTCRCRPGPGWLCVRTGAAPDFRFCGVLFVAILHLGYMALVASSRAWMRTAIMPIPASWTSDPLRVFGEGM